MYVCVFVYTCENMCMSVCVCVHVHVCVCVYMCTCACGGRDGQNKSTDSQNFRAPTLCLHEKECETGVVVEAAALTAHPTTQSYNLFIYKV